MRSIYALFAAIVLSPPLLAAENPVSPFTNCGSPDARVLGLPVRAMTPELQSLDTLQPGNFVLKDGKAPLAICGVPHDRQPISVGIVLDISGSMGGGLANLPAIARAGIGKLLDTSQPGDEYFLEYVNDVAVMQCGFGCDLRHIRDGLQIEPKGKTALIDGLYMALQEMPKAHHANRALLVVSDGIDTLSIHKFEEVERAYAGSPVPIFFLAPVETSGPAELRMLDAARERLDRLAGRSGGYSVAAFGEKEALADAAELSSVIHSPYILYFASPRQSPTLRVAPRAMRPKPLLFYGAAFETRPRANPPTK
jgi:Ca-activated chloride channel homolog